MAISQLVLLVLVAWIAPSFAKIDENINYKKILDRKSFVQPIKSIHTVSPYVFWGRGRQYVLNYDSLTKLIQQNLDDWEAYKTLYNKKFDSEDLETERMLAFISAQQTVRRHNDAYDRGNVSFKLAVNSIADLPFNEYLKLNGFRGIYGDSTKKNSSRFLPPMNVQVPDEIDWRTQDYVTEVKNQGQCGSCWAFSTTGALEGQHKRATGQLVSISEQNLVDCSESYGNHGCQGGWMDYAFQYIKENHGIDTENSYPYLAKQDECKFNPSGIGADDTGFVDLPQGDEDQLKVAVATQGPISVAIDAGHDSFQLYKEGIYYEQECSSEKLDHAVLVVGYGTDPDSGDYWLVKNSWGESWGENGYIRMARNRENHCGIATAATYPLV